MIIGHRGHAESLENTLNSFRESIQFGSQMLELDVRLSKDQVPMVCHDSTLRRVTGGKPGSVKNRTSKHLLSLEFGEGHRFTTLEGALAELTPLVPVNVELKFELLYYRPLVDAVCGVIRNLGVGHRILVSSFFHGCLGATQRAIPELSVAPLFGNLTGPPHEDDLAPAFSEKLRQRAPGEYPFAGRTAVVDWKMIDEALVKRFKKAKGTLLTYTVDEPEEMKRLISLGIDGIITNQPKVLKKVLDELFPDTEPVSYASSDSSARISG